MLVILMLLLFSHPLYMIEELLEVLYRQVCTAAILFYTNQVCVHRHEPMYKVFHENYLAVAAKFKYSDGQGE